jgi:hypothetical protein
MKRGDNPDDLGARKREPDEKTEGRRSKKGEEVNAGGKITLAQPKNGMKQIKKEGQKTPGGIVINDSGLLKKREISFET